MIDRFFTLALAAGLLALAVSTAFGFGHGFAGIGPRLVQFERVQVSGKRVIASNEVSGTTATTATR